MAHHATGAQAPASAIIHAALRLRSARFDRAFALLTPVSNIAFFLSSNARPRACWNCLRPASLHGLQT